MPLPRQWSARYVLPVRLQALPRNRRTIRHSACKSAIAAVKRGVARPGLHLPPNFSSTFANAVAESPVQLALPSPQDTLTHLLGTPLSESSILSFSTVFEQYMINEKLMSNVGFCELFAQTAAYFRDDAAVIRIMETGGLHGVSFTSSGYENVLRQWIRNSKWVLALHLSELLIETPSLLSPRILRLRARALFALRMYHSLRGLLDVHTMHHIPRTRRLYNILIRASLEAGDISWARSLLRCMETDGFVFDATTYSSILAGYRALGPDAAVESRIYRDLRQLGLLSNSKCLNALMQSRFDAGDVEGARAILNLFHDHTDTSETDQMYECRSTLLNKHGHVKDIDHNPLPSAAPTSQTPSSDSPTSPSPEISTFNILLAQCAKLGDIEKAVSIWARILALGLAPTAHTIVAVMRTLLAQRPFETSQAQCITFVASIAYGTGSNRAAKFCERLQSRFTACEFSVNGVHVQPSIFIFSTLLSGVLQQDLNRSLLRVEGLLEEMKLAGVEPSAETLSVFLKYMEKHAGLKPDELSALAQELTDGPGTLLKLTKPSLHSSKPALSVQAECLSSSTPALSKGLLSAERFSATLQSVTHRTREVRALATSKRPARASRSPSWWYPKTSSASHAPLTLHTAASKGPPELGMHVAAPSAGCCRFEAWAPFIRNAPSAPAAQANFDQMRAQGFLPKVKHYVALMQSYVSEGQVDQAARVLASAMAAGILTSIVMFTVLIVAYGSLGRPDLAHHVFDQMRKQPHLSPDVASVDALARTYIAAGRAADARNVILQNWATVDRDYARRTPEFQVRLRALTLKGLMYALSGLGGAQRKGGRKPVSQARRIATQRIVRRVVKRWRGDTATPGPKKPNFSPRARAGGGQN